MSDHSSTEVAESNKIVRFLQGKNALRQCEACGHNQWTVVSVADNGAAIILIPDNGSFAIPPGRIPVYVLTCNNCFNVRMHAKVPVDAAQ